MKVIDSEAKDYFTRTFPLVMQSTRLLLVDHDVTRYHNFDLLRYTLRMREDLFISMKPEYRSLRNVRSGIAEQVHFMQTKVPEFNIYQMFENAPKIVTMDEYTRYVRDMNLSEHGKITPTDISLRFDVVFDRRDVTGILLQYTHEKHHPSWYNKVIACEVDNPLNLDVGVELIRRHQINAVIASSSEYVIQLIETLIRAKVNWPISFIIGRYAYNFEMRNGKCYIPLYNREFGLAEIEFKHEFGFYDPFGGITQHFHRINEMEANDNGSDSHDSE